jgi:hypothetical protein
MIYTMLAGGLGNQMFQYATARAVALRLQAPLALDASYFPGVDNRSYELGVFHVAARVLGPFEENLLWLRTRRKARRLRRLLSPVLPGHFDERIAQVSGEVYLHGLWQAPAYFDHIRETLQRDFAFIEPPNESNREMMAKICAGMSVALHVRRGDYLVGEKNISLHGLCSLDYYQAAIDRMRARLASPHFFIFSDDPEWARKNLRIDGPSTFIAHNLGRQNHEDLRLMRCSRHFIIANSTFSWWGAYLGNDPQKIIIAPKRWFREQPVSHLCPKTWELLDL